MSFLFEKIRSQGEYHVDTLYPCVYDVRTRALYLKIHLHLKEALTPIMNVRMYVRICMHVYVRTSTRTTSSQFALYIVRVGAYRIKQCRQLRAMIVKCFSFFTDKFGRKALNIS